MSHPELSSKEKIFRLMGMVTAGKVKLPVNFGLRNGELSHSGTIRSLGDIKVFGGEVTLNCDDGEIVVTDNHDFRVNSDGEGKPIFFSNFDH